MSNKTKIILFVFISLGVLGLIAYGVISSRKLDQHKEKKVTSNINEYLYDESKDTINLEEEEEDLDGAEAIDEDDDFEEYKEDNDEWEEEEMPKEEVASAVEIKKEPVAITSDDELEPLYDNTVKSDPEPPKIKIQQAKPQASKTKRETGTFLVIVGSFKSKTNAKKKLNALKKAGVEGEIVQLEGSKLQTVLARRFETESDEEAFALTLETEHDLRAIVKGQ